jgi:Icc-related predicted phosphoesterase
MKVYYASDLHLEKMHLQNPNITGEVLVLAGDIIPIALINPQNPRYKDKVADNVKCLFTQLCNQFKHIVYVAGNHELYYSDINDVPLLKQLLQYDNLHILDNECITIDNVRFIGGTGWSDFNQYDSLTMARVAGCINDYCRITNNGKLIDVYDVLEKHAAFCNFMKSIKKIDGITDIVITHHSPSKATISQSHRDQFITNGCYSSDLTRFMHNINYWIHGHQHFANDVSEGKCRVISNTRGYPHEYNQQFFNLKFIEV